MRRVSLKWRGTRCSLILREWSLKSRAPSNIWCSESSRTPSHSYSVKGFRCVLNR
jgi:hypothetical protein